MKLGRYEVVRELGKGAMGIVYLAKDPLIGRLVALKTIRTFAGADDTEAREFQQRFIREAQAAGILSHPAIVTVHDIGQDEATGTSFIAMEYAEGQNLKEVLAQGQMIAYAELAEVVALVADALDYAHAKGIVHRDVKPANIILLEGRAKITDFGIAKIASSVSNLTSTGQFLGTPNYMAPEQIKGAPVDGRTDIFALGICLYECLTRRKPFGGDSLTTISYKIVHEPFPPLREVNSRIPEAFDDVVGRALAKEPARRYQRASEMAADLRKVARGERVTRPVDPLHSDETVVTAGASRIPTIELPFPDAAQSHEKTEMTESAALRRAAQNRGAASRDSRTALWMPIAAPFFFGTIIVLLALLSITAFSLVGDRVEIPAVDTKAEAQRRYERTLRVNGNELYRQGRVAEAYSRYSELQRLAPQSPHVAATMARMSALLQQQAMTRQRTLAARARYEQGQKLFNVRKFDEAIDVLQQSFTLNPSDNDTVELLKLAQLEAQRARSGRSENARLRNGFPGSGANPTPGAVATVPARLTTVFTSPWTDGYITVKAGGDTLAHEMLYTERQRVFRRRAPRSISVTKEFPPKNADLQVWVVVPSQKISAYHVIPTKFLPGSALRLLITYNAQTRTFRYDLN